MALRLALGSPVRPFPTGRMAFWCGSPAKAHSQPAGIRVLPAAREADTGKTAVEVHGKVVGHAGNIVGYS